MKLVSVYREPAAVDILYELLKERPASVRISHKTMPSYRDHRAFVRSRPYRFWYLIDVDGMYVGDIHSTMFNEIGIFLFEGEQVRGYGTKAVRMVMKKHKPLPAIPARRIARWLANVAPENWEGKYFFRSMGFNLVQETYAK